MSCIMCIRICRIVPDCRPSFHSIGFFYVLPFFFSVRLLSNHTQLHTYAWNIKYTLSRRMHIRITYGADAIQMNEPNRSSKLNTHTNGRNMSRSVTDSYKKILNWNDHIYVCELCVSVEYFGYWPKGGASVHMHHIQLDCKRFGRYFFDCVCRIWWFIGVSVWHTLC